VLAPVERPRLTRGGIRLPRSLREYTSAETATLLSLVNEALEAGPPQEARVASRQRGRITPQQPASKCQVGALMTDILWFFQNGHRWPADSLAILV
jgi:hypothetical protein